MIGNGLLSLEFQVDSMTLGLGGSQGFEKNREYERINNEREKKEVEKEEGAILGGSQGFKIKNVATNIH